MATDPLYVRNAGRTSLIRDPAGAIVSLWQPKEHFGAGLVNEVGTWSWSELVLFATEKGDRHERQC